MREVHFPSILFSVLVGVLLWPAALPAEAAESPDASVLSLEGLIQEALAKNPRLRAAKARWEARKARIGQVHVLDDPELGFDTWNIPSDLDVSETRNLILFLRQRFPFPGTLSLRAEAARAEALQAWEEYEATAREIVMQVKTAYYHLYGIHKAIDVTQETVGILRRFERMARVKYATGGGSQQDVLKAQVELARLANDLVILRQELEAARARLNTLLHRPPRAPLGVPGALVLVELPDTLESLEAMALRQRPELKAARAAIARSRYRVALARRRFYPDFSVTVKRFQNQAIPQPNGWGLSASINIPWVFRKKHDERLGETRHRLAQDEALHRALEDETRFAVLDLWVKIRTAERLVRLYRNSVLPQAEQAVAAALIGYRADRVDFLSLLDSQRRLEAFRLEYYRALVSQNQAVAELERILGTELTRIPEHSRGGLP